MFLYGKQNKFKKGFQNEDSCSQIYDSINEHIVVN